MEQHHKLNPPNKYLIIDGDKKVLDSFRCKLTAITNLKQLKKRHCLGQDKSDLKIISKEEFEKLFVTKKR